ncbi:Secreted effector protein pipB2 [Planctomycetes bacterium Poly30]|uniref:Secreted effector protein pipB2 n=2 Tax=Saltatorellus ferox TaxID=2528018 RepID=A0A518EZI5_9BACT|nr:Secreted effector protein pipB2 [Planctomycetes bacterium Poly30]
MGDGAQAAGPIHHVRADLAGYDFSGCDLRGVDFTGAHLADAIFVEADLTGAILDDVHAESADFSRARLSGASLRRGHFSHARFSGAQLVDADATAAFMDEVEFVGASVRGTVFAVARLQATRWNEADLTGADLRRADLSRADLAEVTVHHARFDDADLSGARLSRVAGFRRASWLGVDAAALDRRGACFVHDFIEDQNFLTEYRSQGPAYEWTYRLWWLTSDCGRSVTRWGICSGVLAALFAFAYTQVGIDYGHHETALSPLYFSVVTLTTLGFGDAVPATLAAQAIVMCEVVIGYVMLGGLLSLISNKLSRRAS